MTRFEPTLVVTRMVVKRGDRSVYDELFHEGVNVIRGENSSGKSTVLNFIYFGLGGDLNDWSGIARLCTHVIVEVRINGNMATLKRDVSGKSGQPMEIFGGGYIAACQAPHTEWKRYPYRSTENQKSFSQALFSLMDIPEVSSDLSGHITMHQILRLLYADQISSVEHIFRSEQFDRSDLRETVGRLLCGAYDSELYDNEQRVRALSSEHDQLSGELKSLYTILGRPGQGFTLEWVVAERSNLEIERTSVQSEIELKERRFSTQTENEPLSLELHENAYIKVQQLQAHIGSLKRERDGIILTIADTDAFVNSTRNKMEALRDSEKVAGHLGVVTFSSCPACYTPINADPKIHACHLCKTPFDSDHITSRITSLILDAGIQITQSEQLQVRRRARLLQLEERLVEIEAEWARASQQLVSLQRIPTSRTREKLRELQKRAGYLERQLEDLAREAQLIEKMGTLSAKKIEIHDEIERLSARNDALRAEQRQHLTVAYSRISDEIGALLQTDLRRQDIFEDAKNVSFTFSGDKISVDDEQYFSASSRAILKSSFCLGFLSAATKTPFFRHPRFCMIDTHENMGVEAIRSQNFQLQILRISKESKVEHQIIYATAMIEPELEEEAYTVGAFSTNDERTIGFKIS